MWTRVKLPAAFLDKMKTMLGNEFPEFLQSYNLPKHSGIRANRLKIQTEQLQDLLPYSKDSIPWTTDGFYYNEQLERPAKHPYYHAGLYYLQEPSAMLPAELLQAQPGDRVLDLCAAPGGKSIQLAAQTGRSGLLVVNDIHPQRAKVLLKNIERYGVVHAIVLNETPDRIQTVFGDFFDKVLVDAPCSGEGMFRKEPEMAIQWSEQEVEKYAEWQADILKMVPGLLKSHGEMVYSTCTFSKEENELQMERFLSQYPNFQLIQQKRLWPHQVNGEGHFAAKLIGDAAKTSEPSNVNQPPSQHLVSNLEQKTAKNVQLSNASICFIEDFSLQIWGYKDGWRKWLPDHGQVIERSGHILWEHNELPSLRGLKVLRSGWLLGTIEKNKFRPSQAFALGLPFEAVAEAEQTCELSARNEQTRYQAIRYLRGETIQEDGKTWRKGWNLVTIDGFPLGWAKGAGSSLKNEYPPGWRWTDGK